jgi:hypothetical protein
MNTHHHHHHTDEPKMFEIYLKNSHRNFKFEARLRQKLAQFDLKILEDYMATSGSLLVYNRCGIKKQLVEYLSRLEFVRLVKITN